jgi:predicted PurR-regulated permease PerM
MKKNIPLIFFLFLLLLITAAFFGLIGDYLLACFWAILLAILFHPTYAKLRTRFKQKENIAAGTTLLLIILLVIIPVMFVGTMVVKESINFFKSVESGEINLMQQIESWQSNLPITREWLESLGVEIEETRNTIRNSALDLGKDLAYGAMGFTQNIFAFFVQFFVMLYILFFFLKDGDNLVEALVKVLPLGDEQEWKLIHRFANVARATVRGSMVVAMVQGALGGILFWAVGIPGAIIWAVIMTILSLLPVGSGLVWGPAAIILMVQGDFVRGIIVLLVGAFVIGLLDNFLRPLLVGRGTKMPDYLILLSTLGGLAWFGISGFVIGPVIAAFFITCWQMLGEVYIVEKPNVNP